MGTSTVSFATSKHLWRHSLYVQTLSSPIPKPVFVTKTQSRLSVLDIPDTSAKNEKTHSRKVTWQIRKYSPDLIGAWQELVAVEQPRRDGEEGRVRPEIPHEHGQQPRVGVRGAVRGEVHQSLHQRYAKAVLRREVGLVCYQKGPSHRGIHI